MQNSRAWLGEPSAVDGYLDDALDVDLLCLLLGLTEHVGPCLPPAPACDIVKGRFSRFDVALGALLEGAIELQG